ncbi:MAG: hypothetical protein ACE15C_20965 [Phycisphaerae bacterium]
MTIVAGIDEAGLGPVLGPLVVSATAFRVPPELAEVSMWQALSACVGRKPGKRAATVAIADSKKLYNSQSTRGILNLERGVLAMLAAMGRRQADTKSLLAEVAPAALAHLSEYPWYNQAPLPLPRTAGAEGVALCGNALAVGMERAGFLSMGPLVMRSEVVFEGEFNRLVAATDNKSVTLFDVTSRLLAMLWRLSASEDMLVFVDRQGGRMHYRESLQRLFPECPMKILDETDLVSSYRLTEITRTGGQEDGRKGGSKDTRRVEFHFLVEAEDKHLPVALASMLSKYLRELFMEMFNGWWAGRVPRIAPTAGYYSDGNRFWSEILPQVQQMGLDTNMLYRSR